MQIIVGGIIEKDNKILMVKEAKKKCYGKWNVPAGHLEDGETVFEGAIREIFEETGCKVRLKKMLPIITSYFENNTFVIITFNKDEILDVKWISKEELECMNSEKLRDERLIKRTLNMLKENKLYPLDVIENL